MRRPNTYSEKPRAKSKWGREHTVELLSELNFIIETRRQNGGRHYHKEEVVRTLQQCLRKRRRTFNQIEGKLRSLWKENVDPHSINTFEEIFRLGTRCMIRLENGLKTEIQEELVAIRDRELLRQISTPRKLRSGSRNVSVESS